MSYEYDKDKAKGKPVMVKNANIAYNSDRDTLKVDALSGTGVFGTATSAASTTLADTNKNWEIDVWKNASVLITDGTGKGQMRKIASNTSDTLTVSNAWTVTPDTTSEYAIIPGNPQLLYTASYDPQRKEISDASLTTPYTTPLNAGASVESGWISATDDNGNRYRTIEMLVNSDYTTTVYVSQSIDGSTEDYVKKYIMWATNTIKIPILLPYVKIKLANETINNQTSLVFDAWFSNEKASQKYDIPIAINFTYTNMNTAELTPDSSTIPTGAYPATPQASYTQDYASSAALEFDKNGERVTKKLKRYDATQSSYNASPEGMLRFYARGIRAKITVSSTDTVDRTVYWKLVANEGEGDEATATGSFTASAGVTTTAYAFLREAKLLDDSDTYHLYLYADDGTNLSFDSYSLIGGAGGGNTTATYYQPQIISNMLGKDIKVATRQVVYDSATLYTIFNGIVKDGAVIGGFTTTSAASTYAYPITDLMMSFFGLTEKNGTANNGISLINMSRIEMNVKYDVEMKLEE